MGALAVELTSADLTEINEAVSKVPVERDRYPAHIEKMTGL